MPSLYEPGKGAEGGRMSPTLVIQGNLAEQATFNAGGVPSVDRRANILEIVETFLASQIPNKKTARGYRRHLTGAFGMMAVEKLSEVQAVHLMNYRGALVADGRGSATHAQALIALRSFLVWCAALGGHDLRSEQFLYLLKVPKVSVITPHETLTQAEILRYLDAAKASCPRDHALALVALGSGVRVAELVNLDIRDIRDDAEGGTTIHVRQGKGSKDRLIPVRKEVRRGIEDYLKRSHRQPGDIGPLFLSEDRAMGSRDNWRLTTKSASRIIKHLAEVADIKKRISPHALRHTFAFSSYLYCRNLVAVSKLFGHSNISTTSRYVSHLDQLDLRRAIPAFLAGGKGPAVLPSVKNPK